jgi:hypothetical protein
MGNLFVLNTQSTVFMVIRRCLVRLLWVVIIGALLILSLLPVGVKFGVNSWFKQQGIEAYTQHFSLSPMVGRIELAGLTGLNEQGDYFQLDNLLLDVDVLALWDKKLVIDEVTMEGLKLGVRKIDDQYFFGGINVASLLNQSGPVKNPKLASDDSPAVKSQAPFTNIILKELLIADVEVCATANDSGNERANLCAVIDEASLSSLLSVDLLAAPQINMAGSIKLKGLRVQDKLEKLNVLSIASVTVESVSANSELVQIQHVNLQGLNLLQRQSNDLYATEEKHHLDMDSLSFSSLGLALGNKKALSLHQLSIETINILVHRNHDGDLALSDRLDHILAQVESLLPVNKSQIEVPVSEGDKPNDDVIIAINSIAMKSSRVFFVDQNIEPVVVQTLNDIQINVSNISNAVTDSVSSVAIGMQVNDHGRIDVAGDLQPFATKTNINIDAKIKAIDMHSLSPYIERNLQYKIQRGQLNNVMTAKVIDNEIEANIEVILNKFYLQRLASEELAKDEEQQNLPVGMALNLLRDGDDKIILELPVSGDMDSPDFSLRKIIGVVFRKALTTAVVNYYTPFGLVNIASAAVDSITQLQFSPMIFQPGVTTLTAINQERLVQLSQLLTAKPQLSLSFCPVVTQPDAMTLFKLSVVPEGGLKLTSEQRKQLQKYGVDRAQSVKKFLIERKILSEQVILCQSEIKVDDKSLATVEVGI